MNVQEQEYCVTYSAAASTPRRLLARFAMAVAVSAVAWLMGPNSAQAETVRGYMIGNSRTGNAQVGNLATSYSLNGMTTPAVGWHLDNSASAYQIATTPNGVGGAVDGYNGTYGTWYNGLRYNTWDYVAIQSYYGNKGTQEVSGFRTLIDRTKLNSANANTKFYIYQDWVWNSPPTSYTTYWNQAYAGLNTGTDVPLNKAYFSALLSQLRTDYPTTKIGMIPVGETLARLDARLRAGAVSGISSAWDLYGDGTHLNAIGDWVAHMTVQSAILERDPATLQCDPYIIANFMTPGGTWFPGGIWNATNVAQFQTVANQEIWAAVQSVPEPASLSLLVVGATLVLRRRR